MSCSDDSENPQSKVTISAISPDKGRPGTEVTITGSGFSPVKSENIVTMGSVEAEVTTATENQLGVFTYSFLPNGWKGIGSDKRNFPTRAMENSLPLINEKNRL